MDAREERLAAIRKTQQNNKSTRTTRSNTSRSPYRATTSRRRWSAEETEIFREAVAKYGVGNWSAMLKDR